MPVTKLESLDARVEVLLRHLADRCERAVARAGEEDVDPTLLALHGVVEPVEVGEIPGVALDARDVPADRPRRLVELLLGAAP